MKQKLSSILSFQEVWQKIVLILKPEKPFYVTTVIYGIGVSILSLAIPISVQALVNTVTFGVLLQPLVILSIALLSLLIFSGTLNALQAYIIEVFQRHFYTRTTTDITMKLLDGDYKELERSNSVKLVNRYFDVMTIQKSVSFLLTGGIDIILQTLVGLILLAFYHPYFLVFDIILLFLLWLAWTIFWRRALVTAIEESKSKYEVASWLEEVAKSNLFFKTNLRKQYALDVADRNIMDYLKNRINHFRHSFLQNISLLVIYALMSAFVLALGGYLVVEAELTLGQLIAAELVVTVILSNFAKSGKYLVSFYDLYAAVDKISKFYDIDIESSIEKLNLKTDDLRTFDLKFESTKLKNKEYYYDFKFNYSFKTAKSYLIRPQYYKSKLILLELAQKLTNPDSGTITIGDYKYSDLNASSIRDFVYVIDSPSIIEGSIYDNLTVGNKGISDAEVRSALDTVELSHIYTTFEEGLSTQIISSGYPLWNSQLLRLEIARVLLLKPKIVILTEVFDQIGRKRRAKILDYLLDQDITVLIFSFSDNDDIKLDKYLFVESESVVEFDNRVKLDEYIEKHDG